MPGVYQFFVVRDGDSTYNTSSISIPYTLYVGLPFKILIDVNTMTSAEALDIINNTTTSTYPGGLGTALVADGVYADNVNGLLPSIANDPPYGGGKNGTYGISPQQWQEILTQLNASQYLVTEDDLLDILSARPPYNTIDVYTNQPIQSDYQAVTAMGFSINAAMVYYENNEALYSSSNEISPVANSIPLSDGFSSAMLLNTTTAPPFVDSAGASWATMVNAASFNSNQIDQIAAAYGSIPLTGVYSGVSYSYNSVIAERTPVLVNSRAFSNFPIVAPNNFSAIESNPNENNISPQWKYYTSLAIAEPTATCSGILCEGNYSDISTFDTAQEITAVVQASGPAANKDVYILVPAVAEGVTALGLTPPNYLTQVESVMTYLSQNNVWQTLQPFGGKIYIVLADYGTNANTGFFSSSDSTNDANNTVAAAKVWLEKYRATTTVPP